MYPEDVKREGDHPAPFPEKLPGRLMRMYTYGRTDTFPGEIILDPFCGTGTACAVAKRMGRQFIGIDISPRYAEMAEARIAAAKHGDRPVLLVGRPKFAGKDELIGLDAALATGNAGQAAETKHKRETYGRSVPKKEQLGFEFKEPDELFEVESDGEGPSNT
jgi:SAM-dependent methyltransferase